MTATEDTHPTWQSPKIDKPSISDRELWEISEKGKDDAWIKLRNGGEYPDAYYRATAEMFGCVEFYRIHNGADWDDENAMIDYIHICSIDDMISRLQALKRIVAEALDCEGWND